MKKRHFIGLFLLAPVVLFFAGPRPDPDLEVAAPTLPDSLDDFDKYLQAGEAHYSDIIPGAEKKIVWADPDAPTRTPFSIVYLHGFSASRQEVAPLCDTLGARIGANLFYTRLRGHGRRDTTALGNVTVNDWLQDSVEALEIGKRLGEKVILVGTSTGATMSTWLLADEGRAEHVAANIQLSPNFAPKDRNARVALWPWGKQIIRTAVGKMRSWEPLNELQDTFWSTRYPVEAVVTLMSLVKVVNEVDLGLVTTPTLVLYSELDDVVSVAKIKDKFPQFGGPSNRLVEIPTDDVRRSHVLAGAIIAPEMTVVVAETIDSYLTTLGISK